MLIIYTTCSRNMVLKWPIDAIAMNIGKEKLVFIVVAL